MIRTARPNAVSSKAENELTSTIAWMVPVAAMTITQTRAIEENRSRKSVRTALRSWSRVRPRVATGSSKISAASPPVQIDIAPTWRTSEGMSSQTGSWVEA